MNYEQSKNKLLDLLTPKLSKDQKQELISWIDEFFEDIYKNSEEKGNIVYTPEALTSLKIINIIDSNFLMIAVDESLKHLKKSFFDVIKEEYIAEKEIDDKKKEDIIAVTFYKYCYEDICNSSFTKNNLEQIQKSISRDEFVSNTYKLLSKSEISLFKNLAFRLGMLNEDVHNVLKRYAELKENTYNIPFSERVRLSTTSEGRVFLNKIKKSEYNIKNNLGVFRRADDQKEARTKTNNQDY